MVAAPLQLLQGVQRDLGAQRMAAEGQEALPPAAGYRAPSVLLVGTSPLEPHPAEGSGLAA